ncbi:MAG: tRNA lysidine(34) synthetase TilS [Gammaproteobacteria bacterium]|nr:tRNA lysidine(34) synthetase TilS [Gammaproteobacteria bacterium]
MIKLLNKVPKRITIAVSGGPDSMAALDFLTKRRDVTAAFFHHGTKASDKGEKVVTKYCNERDVTLVTEKISCTRRGGESREEFWRNARYEFFEKLNGPVITCHHLDDVIEWWIFTSLHGNPRLIPYKRDKYIRPFLLNRKQTLINWCRRNDVDYITDSTNRNDLYSRGYIRNHIIPTIGRINPGIHKTMKKKIIEEFTREEGYDAAL